MQLYRFPDTEERPALTNLYLTINFILMNYMTRLSANRLDGFVGFFYTVVDCMGIDGIVNGYWAKDLLKQAKVYAYCKPVMLVFIYL